MGMTDRELDIPYHGTKLAACVGEPGRLNPA